MLMQGEINFKDLLSRRLEWRKDSEYRGKACMADVLKQSFNNLIERFHHHGKFDPHLTAAALYPWQRIPWLARPSTAATSWAHALYATGLLHGYVTSHAPSEEERRVRHG